MDQFFQTGAHEVADHERVGANNTLIQDDEELEVTRQQLENIEAALASLRSHPMHPDRLQMMSEGYLDYIYMLKSRIQAYMDAHVTSTR